MGSTVVIGITGLIASGKSHVTNIFAQLGAAMQDSDKITHDLIADELKDKLIEEFGTNDRRELGAIVFADTEKLKKLESIIHPEVRKKNLEFIANNSGKIVVLEIPMLFETGANEICDYTVFVNVSRETLQKRAMSRPNMTLEKLESIIAKQTAIGEKSSLADFTVENEPDSDTLKQVKRILEKCVK